MSVQQEIQLGQNGFWRFVNKLGQKIEPVMLFMGFFGPLATLPQIIKLYFSHSHHAPGLSLTTWVLYGLMALLWTVYGLYHKNATIWAGNCFGFLMDLAMVVGILMHSELTF